LRCLEVPIFRCNGEDGHFNPQTYSPFVVFTLCVVRLTLSFLYLRNVLSDSLPHSLYLHYGLPILLPIPYIYSMRCHTHHHFLHVHYELSDSPPKSFIYIMRCITRSHFIFMLWAAHKKIWLQSLRKLFFKFFFYI
jgi:hypothetical protein